MEKFKKHRSDFRKSTMILLERQRTILKKRFQKVAEILYPALHDEPGNLSILNGIARTLFWIRVKRLKASISTKS